MSTRSNILVTDGDENLLFYRHSDGYPTGQRTLIEFMKLIKEGEIRNNVNQSAGWLIVFGHKEYCKENINQYTVHDWKVGAYEPTDMYGGDIEFFYVCDIKNMNIKVYSANMWEIRLDNDGLKSQKNIDKAIH